MGSEMCIRDSDQVTLITKERYPATSEGRKRAERSANLAYVFNTFEPGRGCLFCLSGWIPSLPFENIYNDIGRFARHLMEWHVEFAWSFMCRKNKVSGLYDCVHNGRLMNHPFSTMRVGLFIRHRTEGGTGHRQNIWETRRITRSVWLNEPTSTRFNTIRGWDLEKKPIKGCLLYTSPSPRDS